MRKTLLALLTLLALCSPSSFAAPAQKHSEIRAVAAAFVRAQTQGLPGKVEINVSELDQRIALPACPALEAFLPAGAQLNGNSNVGVRCNVARGWSVFVPVTVKVSVSLL